MKRTLWTISLIAFSLFLCCISSSFFIVAGMAYRQNQFLSNGFRYICRYEGKGEFVDDFYLMNRYYTFFKDTTQIKSDILLSKTEDCYSSALQIEKITLKSNEILVSENLLFYYQLAIGDTLVMNDVQTDQQCFFEIKGAIPCCYNLTSNNLKEDKGIIVCGFSDQTAGLLMESIAFLSQENVASVSLKSLIAVSESIQENERIITKSVVFISVMLLLCCVVMQILYFILTRGSVQKQIISGRSFFKIIFKNYGGLLLVTNLFAFVLLIWQMIVNYVQLGIVVFLPLSFGFLIAPCVTAWGTLLFVKNKVRRL